MKCQHPILIDNGDGTVTCKRCWKKINKNKIENTKEVTSSGYTILFKSAKGKWYLPVIASKDNKYWNRSKEFLHGEGFRLKWLHSYIKGFKVVPISKIKGDLTINV